VPRACSRRSATGPPATTNRRTPTWSCSTPAPCARTPTTGSTARSGTSRRTKERARADGADLTIVVGGCLAQKDGATVAEKAPWVDVVYGTHNLPDLPKLLAQADSAAVPVVELVEQLETFPSALPAKREVRHHAWVSISVGCDNSCTFCIVPSPARSGALAPAGEIVAEVSTLVADGVVEVTLLGQNVNSYGRDLFGRQPVRRRCCASSAPSTGSSGSGSPPRTPGTSPRTCCRRWRTRPTSCRTCTCRCSPGPTGCCGPCGAPTGSGATSRWSSAPASCCPTPRSPPTSSWASPGRPRRTSRPPSTWSSRSASTRPSPSSTRRARARRRRSGWTSSSRPEVVAERYKRLEPLVRAHSREATSGSSGPPRSCWSSRRPRPTRPLVGAHPRQPPRAPARGATTALASPGLRPGRPRHRRGRRGSDQLRARRARHRGPAHRRRPGDRRGAGPGRLVADRRLGVGDRSAAPSPSVSGCAGLPVIVHTWRAAATKIV
jgi:hypothetical protein